MGRSSPINGLPVKQRVLHPSLEYPGSDDLIQSGTTTTETRYDGAAQAHDEESLARRPRQKRGHALSGI
jgi:hypothetical protein